ncbi:MAG: hypothetical protein VB119_06930 [Candidatus Metalachnospira sp.]|nr:hypothetical protein [Candidatus Metalachnospira sp.]
MADISVAVNTVSNSMSIGTINVSNAPIQIKEVVLRSPELVSVTVNSNSNPISMGSVKLVKGPFSIGAIGIRLPGGATGIPVASDRTLGVIKAGENLKISPEGVLSVDTATSAQQDNTKPITSGAVFMEIGNIEALLNTI